MAPNLSRTSAYGLQESLEAFDSLLFEIIVVHLIQFKEPYSFARLRSQLSLGCRGFFIFEQPEDQVQPILFQTLLFKVGLQSSKEAVSVEEHQYLQRPAINQARTSRLTCHSEESDQG